MSNHRTTELVVPSRAARRLAAAKYDRSRRMTERPHDRRPAPRDDTRALVADAWSSRLMEVIR